MIQVETSAPVYSNFGKKKVNPSSVVPKGTPTKQETRQLNRETRRTDRKAKRNAPKLKRVKRKNGATALVMKLIKLIPNRKQKFSGVDGSTPKADLITFQRYVINTKGDKTILGKGGSTGFGDDGVYGAKSKLAWDKYGNEYTTSKGLPLTPTPTATTPTPTGADYTKTFEDGTTLVIPAQDVIVNTAGVFDKSDIARALGVPKESLTPAMIEKYLVYVVPTTSGATTTTETDKSATADVSIVIDPTKVVSTPEGDFLATDVQDPNAPVIDVAQEQKAEQKPLVKWEKYLLWGGIGIGVLIIGYIIYKKTSKK
jgi:hypothetical protein